MDVIDYIFKEKDMTNYSFYFILFFFLFLFLFFMIFFLFPFLFPSPFPLDPCLLIYVHACVHERPTLTLEGVHLLPPGLATVVWHSSCKPSLEENSDYT